jgi:hypothetical protein
MKNFFQFKWSINNNFNLTLRLFKSRSIKFADCFYAGIQNSHLQKVTFHLQDYQLTFHSRLTNL